MALKMKNRFHFALGCIIKCILFRRDLIIILNRYNARTRPMMLYVLFTHVVCIVGEACNVHHLLSMANRIGVFKKVSQKSL